MPVLTIPIEQRQMVPQWLAEAGVNVKGMGNVIYPEISWQRLVCRECRYSAMVAMDFDTEEEFCFVVVSTDLRRLPLFWRWVGDWRLVRRIARILVANGAADLDREQ